MSMNPPEPNVTPCPTFPATKLTAFVAEGVFAICRSLVEPSMVYQLTIPGGAGTQLCASTTVAGTAIASATAIEAAANRRAERIIAEPPRGILRAERRLPSHGRRPGQHAATPLSAALPGGQPVPHAIAPPLPRRQAATGPPPTRTPLAN